MDGGCLLRKSAAYRQKHDPSKAILVVVTMMWTQQICQRHQWPRDQSLTITEFSGSNPVNPSGEYEFV